MACKYTYNGVEYSKEQLISKLSNENSNFQTLYNNLVNEITNTETGRKVLDRIKRDYQYKSISFTTSKFDNLEKLIEGKKLLESKNETEDVWKIGNNTIANIFSLPFGTTVKEALKLVNETIDGNKYSLEEQQEEAIVELLGLMTAEKLDNVKDGKLISLLKRLLKEMKQFIRSLINQKEVEIDKLPDNMTINDLADLLAYSNSKLILPGYEVEYTTPDNNTFKTYQEASNHISQLAKSVENVDLDNINIDNNNFFYEGKNFIKKEGKWFYERYKSYYKDYDSVPSYKKSEPFVKLNISKGLPITYDKDVMSSFEMQNFNSNEDIQIHIDKFIKNNPNARVEKVLQEKDISKLHFNSYDGSNAANNLQGFIEKNKEYEQSKEIIEEWKKVNNIQYNPEEIYSRGQEFSSVVGAYSNFDVNLMMQNLLSHIEDNEKAGGKFAISAYTKPIDKQIGHLEGGGGKIKFKIYPKSEDILWAANTDVFSGSVWDASEKVNKDKKSELLGVSYTKYPSLRNVNSVQPNLASIVDDLSHHHNELGIVLTGNNFRLEYDEDIPYTTKKIIDSINKILDQKYGRLIKPEIKKINSNVSKLVELQNKLQELEEEKQDLFSTSDYASIDDKYAQKLDKEIDNINSQITLLKTTKSLGVAPKQTKNDLKESIESVKNKTLGIFDNSKYVHPELGSMDGYNNFESDEFKLDTDTFKLLYNVDKKTYNVVKKFPNYWQAVTKSNLEYYSNIKGVQVSKIIEEQKKLLNEKIEKFNKKEYTEQALINTKIAALKEVAKKYPRSLIRSEVVLSNKTARENRYQGFEGDELPFQKIPSNQSVKPRVEENPVRIFYQLAPDSTRKELNQELTRFVKDILNKMGISTRTFEEYLKDFNRKNPDQQMDMVAFSDMFNRIIAYNEKTQDGTTLSEEMWHFIIDMMWDSPEVKEIRELKDEDGNLVFKKSGIWERESLDYYKIYSQTISNKKELDEKVEKEIIAKLLAQNLYDNFQGEEGFLGRFKMIIRNIYNKIIGRFIGKIRRANIKTKDVNDELNNVLNKLNLQLRYGQLYDNVVTGSQSIKKTNNITKDNGDLEDRYKIPITKDLFSHRVLVVAIRTLKDKLQHLKDTKTGLYNEELNKNWNKYSKILKEHIGLTSFTDIHDLKTSLDEYQNGNPSEVNTEKGIMIEEAFNKMRQLIILSSEDRRKINEIASIQRRVTSLQKQYAANQFQFGIFAFFFGNDGEVEINNNQLNEDIKESSEGVITDLNKVLTRISEIQNDNLELTPVEFQKIVNAYSEYEPIIKRLNDIFNNGYNFNELTVEQNEKLKKTMDSLARYQLTDINDFLVNKSTAANLKEMERYALETNTMNPALEARIKSGNGNIGSIGIARLMFGSAVNSMEDWISMFSRKIMDIQNKVTRKSHDEAQELIGSIRDEISNANDSDMRSIMEQDENGVPTGYYINPYNVGKHSKAFEKAAKDIVDAMDVRAKKIGFTQGFPSNRDARHKMWSGHYLPNFDIKVFNALKAEILKYKKNEIPEQLAKRWEKIKAEKVAYDNGIANLALLKIEHDKLWANWFSKNTMPHPDAEQIINDRRKNMSESEYNLWYKKSVKVVKDMEGNEIGRYYKGELAIPSDGRVIDVKTFNPYGELITTKVQTIDYKNPKYNSLSAKNKKIVDTLVKYKTKAALKLPINFTYEFAMRLPQRSASKSDISIGKKYVKENVKEWVSEFFDNKIDNQLFGEEINGVQIPRPRIQYVHKLDDPKLISQDLIMSTIMFMRMSINYEENMLAIPELEGMKQMAKYNKIKQNRDALIPDPNNIMEWVSKGASVISNFGTNENEDDKLIAKMQNMLNTHVYGIKYANPTETTRKLAPFLEKMRTYIRDLRLLGSAASAIKGMVSAIVDTMGVSFINRYFDKKDLTFGVKEYLKESHSRIYQSSSILKTTKSEVLADSLGLVGSLERNTANNTRTRVWRMITKSVDYGNYVSADRNIKYPIMIAISNTLRYYNGKLYSQKDFPGTKEEYNKAVTFWNSVSVENGRIKYKDYVKESDINYFTNMVKSVAARMDGQLMDIDRGAVYNNAFLQFLTINTQFLYQQLDLFFSGQRYDYLLQRNEAGYGGTIARNFDRIFLPGLSRSFDEMTDAEKDAAKQIYTFMVTALILNTLAFILIAGYVDDDKDKDPFWKFLTYIILGSAMEHLGRYSAEDVLRYILAPTQGGEEGKNALAALMQLITCAFVAEETVGANSMYEGYSKTDQSVIRSIPLVRGAFETWAGGYVNEVLNKPATSIATSYSGKTKLVRDKIYNENWGVGLTWPSRAGGNFIGNQIAKRLGYEYQWKNLIQLPIKKEKENKGKKDNNKKDK